MALIFLAFLIVYIETFRCCLDPVTRGRPLLDVLKDIREFNKAAEPYGTDFRRNTIGLTFGVAIEDLAHRQIMASINGGKLSPYIYRSEVELAQGHAFSVVL